MLLYVNVYLVNLVPVHFNKDDIAGGSHCEPNPSSCQRTNCDLHLGVFLKLFDPLMPQCHINSTVDSYE